MVAVALHEPVRFFNACSLRRSRSAAQLNVGKRNYTKVYGAALKAAKFSNGLFSTEQRVLPANSMSALSAESDLADRRTPQRAQ
jgi:hypothetical protein